MISNENIRLAIIKAAKNAKKNNKRHKKMRSILKDIDKCIPVVRDWILNFEPVKHKPVEINDGISAKKRFIIVPTVEEMIVHHAVTNVLAPILKKDMYEHSYASIPGRGLHAGMKITRKWIFRDDVNTKYCLKLDIKKFFNSIDQDVLIARLEKKIRDKYFLSYLKKIIKTTDSGIPLGFTTSQWFANFLLTELDHKIKEEFGVKHYIRFMDDMILFGSNKRELRKVKNLIESYLNNELHLQLKDNWQIFFMDSIRCKKKKGKFLDFLGFKFYRKHTGLRRKIALKAQRKAKRIYKKGIANIHDARQMVVYAGFVKYANCYQWFISHIRRYVSIKKLRHKISSYDKKHNKQRRESK